MKNKENKKFAIMVVVYTVMITSLIIFSTLYDFNVVKDFIYSNF